MRATSDLIDTSEEFRSINQSTTEDGSFSDDEAAWQIAEALGVRVDRCRGVVDAYGAEYSLAALADIQGQLRAGNKLYSPIAVMISKLKRGEVQVAQADPHAEWMRVRWHKFMSDPTLDCVPKQAARKSGDKTVRCICCGESFPSEVS